jgi:hypothetical protein
MNLISICFSRIVGAPKFLESKEESMACVLRRDGVTDSGKLSAKVVNRE